MPSPFLSLKVVLFRHHLYALVGRDVMVASFFSVAVVTVGAMAAIVGGMTALMLAGMAQVGENKSIYNNSRDRSKTTTARFGHVHLS